MQLNIQDAKQAHLPLLRSVQRGGTRWDTVLRVSAERCCRCDRPSLHTGERKGGGEWRHSRSRTWPCSSLDRRFWSGWPARLFLLPVTLLPRCLILKSLTTSLLCLFLDEKWRAERSPKRHDRYWTNPYFPLRSSRWVERLQKQRNLQRQKGAGPRRGYWKQAKPRSTVLFTLM